MYNTMDIPIVQGEAIPVTAKADDHRTPYVTNADGSQTATFEQPQAQREFKDVGWAIAFVLHLVAMVILISLEIQTNVYSTNHSGILWIVIVSGLLAVALSVFSLGLMMRFAKTFIQVALVFSVAMSLAVGILGVMSGQTLLAVMGFISFAIGVCYACAVQSRIPFAAANLNTALTAVKSNIGLTVVAYAVMFLAFGWTIFWFLGLGDSISTSSFGVLFLLLLSYYWTHAVLENTVHVTTAGTIGTWWFVPDEASSAFSPAIKDSFVRATTTSFGSICFGSFLLAIVQSLRAARQMAHNSDDYKIVALIIDCILACIEDMIEYMNKWAYVYVGLYGFGYLEAGRNVIQLFQHKGWTVVITDNLTDNVLSLVALLIGLITGLLTFVMAVMDPSLLASLDVGDSNGGAGFLIGLISGVAFSSILMGVVGSAINTVIVCYAESPAEFETNHPQLSAEMRASWTEAYPGLNVG